MPRYQKSTKDDAPPTGEPMVWLTSLGLGTGLLLVIWLLLVILSNGLAAFWPKQVVELTLKPDSGFELVGSSTVAGELSGQREKADGEPESWYFVGNRRIYGESFKWIDDAAIAGTSSPDDILVIERMEYGRAIGYPVSISFADGTQVQAGDSDFEDQLKKLAKEAHAAREVIEHIREKNVGKIAKRLGKLELKEYKYRATYEEGSSDLSEALAPIEKERTELQAESDAFAAEAAEKEAELNANTFTYRLASGQEIELPAGELIEAYFPNRLSWLQRFGRFLVAMWKFLIENPREANTEGGVFPAIFGTFVMTVLMSVLVTPLGVVAAIYLREYAHQGPLVRSVRIAVNNLAGVPSIVFGVFGLGFFIYIVGGGIDEFFFSNKLAAGKATFGTGGLLWASATLALMDDPRGHRRHRRGAGRRS